MMNIYFSGWTMCRLATNPDPFDDPRGTRSSFNQFAYPGEPDLDRIIRMNSVPFQRTHTNDVGVTVNQVKVDNSDVNDHMLLGARIDLIDDPVFEGRNVVIADDTREPIYPFHLKISNSEFELHRKRSPSDEDYPYPEYLPSEAGPYPQVVQPPASISSIDHSPEYATRLSALKKEALVANENDRPGIEERISVLDEMQGPGANIPFAMRWTLGLIDSPRLIHGSLKNTGIDINKNGDWTMDFWFGAYDRDGQSFYCDGLLSIPNS